MITLSISKNLLIIFFLGITVLGFSLSYSGSDAPSVSSSSDSIDAQATSQNTQSVIPDIVEPSNIDPTLESSSNVQASASSTLETATIPETVSPFQTTSFVNSASNINVSASFTTESPGIFVNSNIQSSMHIRSEIETTPHIREIIATLPAQSSMHIRSEIETTPHIREIIATLPAQSSMHIIASFEPVMLEQNLIPNNVLTIVYDHTQEHNELVIFSNETALSRVIVTEDTNEPRLDMGNLLDTNGTSNQNMTLTYPNSLEMDVIFDGIEASLLMEDQTKITGPPEWDGVMNLPIFTETTEIDSPDSDSEITSVLKVGLDDEMLVFDKPIRIVFDDRAGQQVGFQRGDEQSIIDVICDDDDSDLVNTQLDGNGDCYLDVGSDLVVWTFHFTEFFTMTEMEQPAPDQCDTPPCVDDQNPPIPDEENLPNIPDVIPDEPEISRSIADVPTRNVPRSSSGGGGGGGGGSSSGIFTKTVTENGLYAVLDFVSNGKDALTASSSLRLEPGNDLTIIPTIQPDDYSSDISSMKVQFYGDNSKLVGWIHYLLQSGLFAADTCDGTLLEYDRIMTCNADLFSSGVPSYHEQPDESQMVFESMVIPLQGEFSGHLSMAILDTRGFTLLSDDEAMYDIQIAEFETIKPVVAESDIVSETIKPEPVEIKPNVVESVEIKPNVIDPVETSEPIDIDLQAAVEPTPIKQEPQMDLKPVADDTSKMEDSKPNKSFFDVIVDFVNNLFGF